MTRLPWPIMRCRRVPDPEERARWDLPGGIGRRVIHPGDTPRGRGRGNHPARTRIERFQPAKGPDWTLPGHFERASDTNGPDREGIDASGPARPA
jgi:hypothetical protein